MIYSFIFGFVQHAVFDDCIGVIVIFYYRLEKYLVL